MKIQIPLSFDTDELFAKAQSIALNYNFLIDNNSSSFPRLNLTEDALELLIKGFSPLRVDFNSYSYKRRSKIGKQQGLVRACKPMPGMNILDVTAGWGRDSALLASFGANVLMLERQPVMAALLDDALVRFNQDLLNNDLVLNHENPSKNIEILIADEKISKKSKLSLSLMHVDAIDYLSKLEQYDYPDIIYIDPMHPERQKSALVKKDMQALQKLFGPDLDAIELLNMALSRSKKRVVVKWPQRLPPILKPNSSIGGKTVRFDLFDLGVI